MATKIECDLCKKLMDLTDVIHTMDVRRRGSDSSRRVFDLCAFCMGILEGIITWPKDGGWKTEIRNLATQLKVKQISEALDEQIEEQKQTNKRRFRQQVK